MPTAVQTQKNPIGSIRTFATNKRTAWQTDMTDFRGRKRMSKKEVPEIHEK